METVNFKEDIKTFGITVKTFPTGIKEAFDSLINKVGNEGREYYGVSWMDGKGSIVYMAVVTEDFEGEGKQLGCEPFTIVKGNYLAEKLENWMPKVDQVKGIFMAMMDNPQCDKTFPCVEWYKNDSEMYCMMRMAKAEKV